LTVELLTMGAGDDIFSSFGHAALRVRGPRRDIVYNFGYTRFAPRLLLDFIRGEARFWGAKESYRAIVGEYASLDRSVYRQPLRLSPAQHRRLARLLDGALDHLRSTYVYDHFRDNCATRLRDVIDRATAGAVRRQLAGRSTGTTYRQLAREGFAGSWPLLLATETFLGRPGDHVVDRWEAGFLPRLLAADLRRVVVAGQQLAPPPELVHRRRAPPAARGDPRTGVHLLWLSGLLLLALGAASALALRARRRLLAAAPLALLGAILTFVALPIWGAVLLADLPELCHNELALLFWPTDALLFVLAARARRARFAAGPLLKAYLSCRASTPLLALLGHGLGLLLQRPLVWIFVAAAATAPLALAVWQLPTGTERPRARAERTQPGRSTDPQEGR